MANKSELAKAASKYISTKKVAKPTVAKKDGTNVARKKVNELVGDKPSYMFMTGRNATKADTIKYNEGFRKQILKDKIAGKPTYKTSLAYGSKEDGRAEASVRRGEYGKNNPEKALKPSATVRDSSIPLAPTQFPD
jgi:hypothetical protein